MLILIGCDKPLLPGKAVNHALRAAITLLNINIRAEPQLLCGQSRVGVAIAANPLFIGGFNPQSVSVSLPDQPRRFASSVVI
jgi:hypothetical protein